VVEIGQAARSTAGQRRGIHRHGFKAQIAPRAGAHIRRACGWTPQTRSCITVPRRLTKAWISTRAAGRTLSPPSRNCRRAQPWPMLYAGCQALLHAEPVRVPVPEKRCFQLHALLHPTGRLPFCRSDPWHAWAPAAMARRAHAPPPSPTAVVRPWGWPAARPRAVQSGLPRGGDCAGYEIRRGPKQAGVLGQVARGDVAMAVGPMTSQAPRGGAGRWASHSHTRPPRSRWHPPNLAGVCRAVTADAVDGTHSTWHVRSAAPAVLGLHGFLPRNDGLRQSYRPEASRRGPVGALSCTGKLAGGEGAPGLPPEVWWRGENGGLIPCAPLIRLLSTASGSIFSRSSGVVVVRSGWRRLPCLSKHRQPPPRCFAVSIYITNDCPRSFSPPCSVLQSTFHIFHPWPAAKLGHAPQPQPATSCRKHRPLRRTAFVATRSWWASVWPSCIDRRKPRRLATGHDRSTHSSDPAGRGFLRRST
jgi:hypothetical protein